MQRIREFAGNRRSRLSARVLTMAFFALIPCAAALAQENNQPPQGFTALFNGKDFKDWTGGATRDPREVAALPPAEREKHDAEMKRGLEQHWKVENGELVSDGKEPYLATKRDYGDFDMWVDWKINAKGDSGIYLRGTPQVQIWDPATHPEGSGALFNNQKPENPNKPLVCADRPVGE